MENIDTASLATLILDQRASIDAQFQIWLTVTFALLAAAFVIKEKLKIRYKFIITLMYLLATITLVSRWVFDARETVKFIEEISRRGVEFYVPKITIVSRFTLIILGSLTTVFFIFVPHDNLITKGD